MGWQLKSARALAVMAPGEFELSTKRLLKPYQDRARALRARPASPSGDSWGGAGLAAVLPFVDATPTLPAGSSLGAVMSIELELG